MSTRELARCLIGVSSRLLASDFFIKVEASDHKPVEEGDSAEEEERPHISEVAEEKSSERRTPCKPHGHANIEDGGSSPDILREDYANYPQGHLEEHGPSYALEETTCIGQCKEHETKQ